MQCQHSKELGDTEAMQLQALHVDFIMLDGNPSDCIQPLAFNFLWRQVLTNDKPKVTE